MSNHDALRVATIFGAEAIGLGKELGSIRAGTLADLVVLDRNPLDDIRNTDSVRWTVVNGRVFDAHTMDELGNHPRKRGAFFFERTGGAVQRTVDLD
jgi:cytosine/adenosine deaminase-related metal-dependent hydrolase